jgi:hypothetical protein
MASLSGTRRLVRGSLGTATRHLHLFPTSAAGANGVNNLHNITFVQNSNNNTNSSNQRSGSTNTNANTNSSNIRTLSIYEFNTDSIVPNTAVSTAAAAGAGTGARHSLTSTRSPSPALSNVEHINHIAIKKKAEVGNIPQPKLSHPIGKLKLKTLSIKRRHRQRQLRNQRTRRNRRSRN